MGIVLAAIVFTVLVILKLAEVLAVSWLVVFAAPIIVILTSLFLILAIAATVASMAVWVRKT